MGSKRPFGSIWGASWTLLGASWLLFGRLLGTLGRAWAPRESLRRLLGAFWAVRKHFWKVMGSVVRGLGSQNINFCIRNPRATSLRLAERHNARGSPDPSAC